MAPTQSKREKAKALATRRPAETASAATGALVAAIATILGLDLTAEVLAALVLVVGAIPALVTGVVDYLSGRYVASSSKPPN